MNILYCSNNLILMRNIINAIFLTKNKLVNRYTQSKINYLITKLKIIHEIY